jgi:RNA polymerase sigma-70 factor (ECF subfamily)
MDWQGGSDRQEFLLSMTSRLRSYMHMLLGNLHDAEDGLQEVFIKYLSRGPAPSDQAAAWLFQVARNQALNVIRERHRRTAREQAHEPGPPPADPAHAAGENEAVARIGECLSQLPLESREMLYLRVAEGLSVRQIAERLGTPKSTVALRIQQGLVDLNRLYFQKDAPARGRGGRP